MISLFKKSAIGIVLTAALFVLALAPVNWAAMAAQVVNGSLSGTVVDPTGAVVPDVQITATNSETQQQFKSKSDSAGIFRLSLLPVGIYNIEFTKPGFSKLAMGKVAVSAGADRGLGNVTITLGPASTTVEVTSAPPLIESTEAQVSTTFTTQELATFPAISANQGLDYLALQIPGVSASRDNNFSNTNGVGITVDGVRGRNNDQEIDGQNNNDNSVAGPSLFLSNPDFVQEYQITTNNFEPEYGRNSGSVINLITPVGTNKWHGTIKAAESNSVLTTLNNFQSNPIFGENLTQPPWFNNIFTSTTIGGPVVKDHVFLFGGFDNQTIESRSLDVSSGDALTPTGLGELASCYPNSDSVAAMQAHGPFAIGGGSPTVTGATNITLVGPDGMTPCTVEVGGVTRSLGTPYHEYDFVTRGDFVYGKDRVYARYLFNKSTGVDYDDGGSAAAGYPYSVPALSQAALLGWTRSITNSMTNELRVGYTRLNVTFGGNNIGNTIPLSTGLPEALSHWSFGNFNCVLSDAQCTANDAATSTPLSAIGPPTNLPQGRIVNTYQIQDNWSWVHGKHQWNAGVNFTDQRSPNIFLPDLNGAYSFQSFTAPAGGFVSKNAAGTTVCSLPGGAVLDSLSAFACDIPSNITAATGNYTLDFSEKDVFLYVGDDYKLTPSLTLNLGLTWSYFGQPADLFHNLDSESQSGDNPLWDPTLPTSVTVFPKIPTNKTDFGPGIGFAYSPHFGPFSDGKTVFRGGYRLAYDPSYYNIYLNVATSAPQVLLQTLGGAAANTSPLVADPIGTNVRAQLTASGVLSLGTQDPRFFNQTTVTPHFKPDGVHSWSFGIQHQLTNSVAVEARYVGNHGYNLFQSVNANPYIADLAAEFPNEIPSGVTPCTDMTAPGFGRVNCSTGLVRERTNTAYSDYNGLQLEFRSTQLFHQLTLHSNYTYSKTTDNASEIFSTFGGATTYAFSQNPFNYTGQEHGLSGLDYPNTWTLNFVEQIPIFNHREDWMGHLLGGWILSGTYIIQSGQTYTPNQLYFGTYSGAVGQDTDFDASFIGSYETFRPFLSNPGAPLTSIGVYAGDACSFFGAACTLSPDSLIDFTAVNTTGTVTPVTGKQVRFIMNGGEAQSIYGTPWGTAGRNSLRDYHTNVGNFSVIKRFKINDRSHVEFRTDFLNVFNHPNYQSVDPILEDAGYSGAYTGFGIPQYTPSNPYTSPTGSANRAIVFGLKIVY
ncbi:MAG: carboxypeptidase-like regulatory domain-containing protein [Candidatus Acidiferrales bacterium]